MTLTEILTNEELRRHEFPVTQRQTFLAHAGVCPLPRRVAEAMQRHVALCTGGDQETQAPVSPVRRARELAAQLLQAQPSEIALVGPTSLALSFVAGGLTFRRGENVLIYHDDYPANVYPWMALAERGVEVRFLNIRELGRIRVNDVIGQVDERTRLVSLASCHFLAGYRLELDALGEALHRRNIPLCVDAIQTLGAFPTTVKQVDFLAADAHKWLLGPCAAGILYVRQALQDQMRPTALGWHNVQCPDFVAQDELRFRRDARRYEAGTANEIGFAGLAAALELVLEIGVAAIAAELLRKRAWLVPALQGKGYVVLQANAPAPNASGIVTFHREGTDMAALHQRLIEASIVTSLRGDRAGRHYVRLSPHCYNTDAELQRVLEIL